MVQTLTNRTQVKTEHKNQKNKLMAGKTKSNNSKQWREKLSPMGVQGNERSPEADHRGKPKYKSKISNNV